MAVFYNPGEQKIRPGVYQRHVNTDFNTQVNTSDGFCAIPLRATWGPLGKVVKNNNIINLEQTYGTGTYDGSTYTVPAAEAMFRGGAQAVYTYRLGTGGAKGTKVIVTGLTAQAKHVGTLPIAVAVQNKVGYTGVKVLQVYANNTQVESFEFVANSTTEGANVIAAAANSNYIDLIPAIDPETELPTPPTTVPILEVASGSLAGGQNPTVTNTDYSNAFSAFETYYYNTIALDVNDDTNLTLSLLLQSYLDNAYKYGKLGIAVVGEPTTVAFEVRASHAQAFNDAKVVYLGGGWMNGTDSMDGVMAICYTAGVIASTPSNLGITHSVITGATDLCESLTYSQYEDAIQSGMLMVSMAPDGSIWYDSGIDTLTSPDEATQDDGWKKIRRVKVRFELINRLDLALSPKVGRVSAGSDGISDIIQAGQRVLNEMANNEGKLQPGAKFLEDQDYPATTDSAWFIIQADDIDSLEKIYLQYQFRYSDNNA